jgi:hypothetical protein
LNFFFEIFERSKKKIQFEKTELESSCRVGYIINDHVVVHNKPGLMDSKTISKGLDLKRIQVCGWRLHKMMQLGKNIEKLS